MVTATDFFKPAGLHEAHTIGEPVTFGIPARDRERPWADVGGRCLRVRERGKERERDGARAGAEIEDLEGTLARRADFFCECQRDAHDGLGIRARIEGVGPELERQSMELALTDDPRDGFAGGAACECVCKPVPCLIAQSKLGRT